MLELGDAAAFVPTDGFDAVMDPVTATLSVPLLSVQERPKLPETGCVAWKNVPVTATLLAMETGCVACQNVPVTG